MTNDHTVEIPSPIEGLTKRERECLALSADGYRQKEIGQQLNISARTVETHLKHVRERLGVADARAAARAWTAYQNALGIRVNPGSGTGRIAKDNAFHALSSDAEPIAVQAHSLPADPELAASSRRADLRRDARVETSPGAGDNPGVARYLGAWRVRADFGDTHRDVGGRDISPGFRRAVTNALAQPLILVGATLAIAAMSLMIVDSGVNVLNKLDVYCRISKTCDWPAWARPSNILRLKRQGKTQ